MRSIERDILRRPRGSTPLAARWTHRPHPARRGRRSCGSATGMLARYSERARTGERDEAHLERLAREASAAIGQLASAVLIELGGPIDRLAVLAEAEPFEVTRRTMGWCTQAKRSAACCKPGLCVPRSEGAAPRYLWWYRGSSTSIATASERKYREDAQSSRMASCHRLIKVIGKCLRPVPQVGDNAAGMTTCASGASASSVGASSRWSGSSSSNTTVPCTRTINRAQRPLS